MSHPKYQALTKAFQIASEHANQNKLAEDILTRVVIECLKGYQQKSL